MNTCRATGLVYLASLRCVPVRPAAGAAAVAVVPPDVARTITLTLAPWDVSAGGDTVGNGFTPPSRGG